jgi:hypothetical protein
MLASPTIVAVTLLAGCAPCGAPDAVPVVANDAPEEIVAQVEAAVADFARWTAREASCVEAVEIVSEVPGMLDSVLGAWAPDERRVYVERGDNDVGSYAVTLHELCHALDTEEALSDGQAARFAPFYWRTEHDRDLYPTEEARLREAFADACGLGPADAGLPEAWQAACGEDVRASWQIYLDTRVWRAPPRTPFVLDAFRATLEPPVVLEPLPEVTYLWDVAGTDGGMALLLNTQLPYDPRIGQSVWALHVATVSLPSGQITSDLPVPLPPSSDPIGTLFTSTGPTTLLAAATGRVDGTRREEVWRVEGGPQEPAGFAGASPFVPVGLPALRTDSGGGVLAKDTAWYTRDDGSGDFEIVARHLPTGHETVPEVTSHARYPAVVDVTEAGVAVATDHDGVVLLDAAGTERARVPPREGGVGMPRRFVGDRVVGGIVLGSLISAAPFVGYNLRTEAWELMASPCDAHLDGSFLRVGADLWNVRTSEGAQTEVTARRVDIEEVD